MASSDTYEVSFVAVFIIFLNLNLIPLVYNMQVDEIVGRRTTRDGKEDYLVRWQNYPPLLTTWEPIQNFSNCQEAIQEYFAKHWPIPGKLRVCPCWPS